jgi:hypothetical protein
MIEGMEQRADRPGDWRCGTCRARVQVTEPRPVPLCAVCGGLVLIARRVEGGTGLVWESPAPTHCAGPAKHRFAPNRVKVGHRACTCRTSGGHATWYCWECGNRQEAPACTSSRAERDRLLRPGAGLGVVGSPETEETAPPQTEV